jgi:S1-C subfamily serine protease
MGVGSGTPADESGLRKDDVLLAANGRPVATVDDLQRVIVLSGPEVRLAVRRGGEDRQLLVRPSPRPRAA